MVTEISTHAGGTSSGTGTLLSTNYTAVEIAGDQIRDLELNCRTVEQYEAL